MSDAQYQYRHRPFPVDAIRWRGDNADDVVAFLAPEGGPYAPSRANAQMPISVLTMDGPRVVPAGSWIVRCPARGLVVYAPAVFEAQYEKGDSGMTAGQRASAIAAPAEDERG